MAIGLKRGYVELADHDPQWEQIARETIGRLWRVFGSVAKDIQHVGSTAIKEIKAKPVIDIAVAVESFDVVQTLSSVLESAGFICVGWENDGKVQPMYQCGEFVSGEKLPRILTHFIHIVIADSQQWHDYINHRDYFCFCPVAAHEYESLKLQLAEENSNNYHEYFLGKQDFINESVVIARLWNEFSRIFTLITPITKGWSEDKKYYVETSDGQRMLLRVSDIAEYDRKKAEYAMIERVYEFGVLTPQPLGFGLCNGVKSVYSLSSWLDGEESARQGDAEKALPLMSEAEQYVYGLKAGETLRKIHSLPAPEGIPVWEERYFGVMDERISAFQSSGICLENDRDVLNYLKDNRRLLKGRPQCFRHGDYSIGNLMITSSSDIAVIDWEADDFDNYGDPWLDFTDVIWSADKSPHFTTGVIKGYFGNEPPVEFWERVMLYVFTAIISSIQWVERTHKEAVENEIRLYSEALRWFDNMNSPVPTWYFKDFYIQWTDGITYKLQRTCV